MFAIGPAKPQLWTAGFPGGQMIADMKHRPEIIEQRGRYMRVIRKNRAAAMP